MDVDVALLQTWSTGDAEAGKQLFQRHFERLYRFFWNKVDDGVEDLVQQTLLGCLEAHQRFRGDAKFSTFVIGVAKRTLYRHYEHRAKRRREDVMGSSIADLGASPSTSLERSQESRALLNALRSIPLDDQVLLELHFWERLAGPELANVLEVPEGTVRSRLRAAKRRLRIALESATCESRSVEDFDAWAHSIRTLHE